MDAKEKNPIGIGLKLKILNSGRCQFLHLIVISTIQKTPFLTHWGVMFANKWG